MRDSLLLAAFQEKVLELESHIIELDTLNTQLASELARFQIGQQVVFRSQTFGRIQAYWFDPRTQQVIYAIGFGRQSRIAVPFQDDNIHPFSIPPSESTFRELWRRGFIFQFSPTMELEGLTPQPYGVWREARPTWIPLPWVSECIHSQVKDSYLEALHSLNQKKKINRELWVETKKAHPGWFVDAPTLNPFDIGSIPEEENPFLGN